MKRIAVLRGGPSGEYAVSMQSGRAVLNALEQLGLPHKDIVITRQGDWLDSGFVRSPKQALEAVDLAFIALHGQYGEDGQIQRQLNQLNIPYTGSNALSSAIAFNKDLTKRTLVSHDIHLPRHRNLSREEYQAPDFEDRLGDFFEETGDELFVKPIASGSSIGARYIPHEAALEVALKQLFAEYEQIMIEEFIRGREATIGVLDNFRGETFYALPTIEIVPPSGKPLFTHEDKYSGLTEEIVPGRFSYSEKSALAEAALTIHQVVGCRQYSRSDFIVRDGKVYFLEINTLPGLTTESLYPKATAAIGLQFPKLIGHLIETASY
jgi:D-alanine-D-alanine ligase